MLDVDCGPLAPYETQCARNLGVLFDHNLKFGKQINAVVKSCFYHLRQLSKVKPFLSQSNFQTVIHAFVTTRLDYCNSLYYGVSQSSLSRLQLVQNAAARLLSGTCKYESITPILSALHWLPIKYRIDFKILLLCIKPSIIWPLSTWQTCFVHTPLLEHWDLVISVYLLCLDVDLKNEVIALLRLQVQNFGIVYLFISD